MGNEYECLRWLFAQADLDLDDYRTETIKRRLPACLRALRVASASHLRAAVRRQPQLLRTAINALLIGVTGFFRDASVFAALTDAILPELACRFAAPRVWSAACSDGAELYSVAMLLAEIGALQRSTLLGSDCRADAIATARQGCYHQSALTNMPPALLQRYMTPDAAGWQVHPSLRNAVQWRSENLIRPEPGAWDLLLCRNLAIYLQPAAAMRLWARLKQCLRVGGILVVGKAERPLGAAGFTQLAPCIYRRDRS